MMIGDIFKNKITKSYYVLVEEIDDNCGRFVMLDDKYSYRIPFDQMELWLSNQSK
jgi:hypothetical protein